MSTLRGGRRFFILLAVVAALAIFALTVLTTTTHTTHTSCHTTRSLDPDKASGLGDAATAHDHASYYLNLNSLNATAHARARGEHLLVLTPLLPESVAFLEHYFRQLDRATYPNHLISIGLLATDAETVDALSPLVRRLQRRWFKRFHEITVYQKTFAFGVNHADPYDLTIMARARNYLLSSALRDFHSWVAWVDVDVVQYPPSVFEDLMKVDSDVTVPNCLEYREDHSFWAFDKSNWAETDYSLEMQKWVGQDYILMDGYNDVNTGRNLLVNMPTHLGNEHKVPLDSVGASFTLVKSHVHREGANFSPFVYQHQVDAEAFGKAANAMGFQVYGLPGYIVYHAPKTA